jgi:ATP-dependent Clp protease ATP-binding subunit ClpA
MARSKKRGAADPEGEPAAQDEVQPEPTVEPTSPTPGFGRGMGRFTHRAQQVLMLAHEEAQRLGHDAVSSGHLLLALTLASDSQSAAANLLLTSGVNLIRLRVSVERRVGHGDRTVAGPLPLSADCKRVLELALGEARGLGHDYVGTAPAARAHS